MSGLPPATLYAALLTGVFGGGHCIAMCGGILGALSGAGCAGIGRQLAYNAGRIASYSAAGATAGAAGATVIAQDLLPVQLALYVIANLILLALGAYLAGMNRIATLLEAPGRALWRHISPLSSRLGPVNSPARAFTAGVIWGWLPCGLTYGVLALALLSGSAAGGAQVMAVFGIGTLPGLLLAGSLLHRAGHWLRRPLPRRMAGIVILATGLAGMAQAADIASQLRRGLLCLG